MIVRVSRDIHVPDTTWLVLDMDGGFGTRNLDGWTLALTTDFTLHQTLRYGSIAGLTKRARKALHDTTIVPRDRYQQWEEAIDALDPSYLKTLHGIDDLPVWTMWYVRPVGQTTVEIDEPWWRGEGQHHEEPRWDDPVRAQLLMLWEAIHTFAPFEHTRSGYSSRAEAMDQFYPAWSTKHNIALRKWS